MSILRGERIKTEHLLTASRELVEVKKNLSDDLLEDVSKKAHQKGQEVGEKSAIKKQKKSSNTCLISSIKLSERLLEEKKNLARENETRGIGLFTHRVRKNLA